MQSTPNRRPEVPAVDSRPARKESPSAETHRNLSRTRLSTSRRGVRRWAYPSAAGLLATALAVGLAPGYAQAVPSTPGCADVEVIFARGTFEGPGVGKVGQAFVDALQARLSDRTVGVYPVNYPASVDFGRAADGVVDASNHIRDVAQRCPGTQIVLGGYSQGAAVSGYVTADTVPPGYGLPAGFSEPMPAQVADHVAAVTLFGKPTAPLITALKRDAPPLAIGAPYANKTLELCAPADPVCQTGGLDRAAHSAYPTNGMTLQAADFAAQQILNRES